MIPIQATSSAAKWPVTPSTIEIGMAATIETMPSADVAFAVTGYVRGTITPLGSTHAWPVVADASLSGPVSLGGGAHGVALTVDSVELVHALDATVADVTEPVEPG